MNSQNSAYIKSLFDSEYIPPQKNSKVMQDSHPMKQAVIQAAMDRHRQQIHADNDAKEKFKKQHFDNIEKDK